MSLPPFPVTEPMETMNGHHTDMNGHHTDTTNGHQSETTNKHPPHNSPSTQIYLVGGGIASLSAAAILIRDADVPGPNIHIIEHDSILGGAMDGSGDATKGYVARGGRMLNLSYVCLYDLLKTIPTMEDAKESMYDQIKEFNKTNKTSAHARLVGKDGRRVDVSKMGFCTHDRLKLLELWERPEAHLGREAINEFFSPHFFTTNFWYMWATTFAFQPWHSLVEYKRYLHRFIQEFPRISTLSGVDRTVYNQFDSLILPIATWLKDQDVDFWNGMTVSDIDFDQEPGSFTARKLHINNKGEYNVIHLDPKDLVFVTNGSMVSSSSLGTTNSAPESLTHTTTDPAWTLWTNLAAKLPASFTGNPQNFLNRVPESQWESFTITLSSPALLDAIVSFSGNAPGTGALTTFKDSAWFMSIVVPHQPHFRNQPESVSVFWGYGLYVDKPGDYIKKPMTACTGEEILQELLYHLHLLPQSPTIIPTAIVIPALMPYITSQFLTRALGDRPKVVPNGSTNFAWLGQWTEIPGDTVFTVEYSVRGAMMAVQRFMGGGGPPGVYRGEAHVDVLVGALRHGLT